MEICVKSAKMYSLDLMIEPSYTCSGLLRKFINKVILIIFLLVLKQTSFQKQFQQGGVCFWLTVPVHSVILGGSMWQLVKLYPDSEVERGKCLYAVSMQGCYQHSINPVQKLHLRPAHSLLPRLFQILLTTDVN